MAVGPVGQPPQARDVAAAAGDLAAARTAYQASLDIAVRLAATDSANAKWQRDLSIAQQKMEDFGNSAEEVASRQGGA